MGHVVFSAANPLADGTVYVYYGAADRVIGLATCRLADLMAFVTGEWLAANVQSRDG